MLEVPAASFPVPPAPAPAVVALLPAVAGLVPPGLAPPPAPDPSSSDDEQALRAKTATTNGEVMREYIMVVE
jgi:hypothetical protein